MIEFKFNKEYGEPEWQWVPVNPDCLLVNIDFKRSSIRIDGVVYTEESKDLSELYNKAIIWMKLKER